VAPRISILDAELDLYMLSRRSLLFSSLRLLTGIALLALALTSQVGCGADGGGGGVALNGTGTVAVVVTDGPTDEFVKVFVTVARVDLLREGGGRHGTIFEGEETFDLLSFESVSAPFVIADDVPAGTYSKIRLELSDIELV